MSTTEQGSSRQLDVPQMGRHETIYSRSAGAGEFLLLSSFLFLFHGYVFDVVLGEGHFRRLSMGKLGGREYSIDTMDVCSGLCSCSLG